jgi:hypothetical protein
LLVFSPATPSSNAVWMIKAFSSLRAGAGKLWSARTRFNESA